MQSIKSFFNRLAYIIRRELNMYSRRPVFLFCMVIAPLLCTFFFTTLMYHGLPTRMPTAIVDEDKTHVTRIVCRLLDSYEKIEVKYVFNNFHEARKAMQQGKIYGFFYIPDGLTEECESQRQPTISFYTNESYFLPASLMFKDFKTSSVLAGLALTRSSIRGQSVREERIMGLLQPITIETHPLNNPFLDYSVYMSNMFVPGIFILLILLTTSYTIGYEWKTEQQQRLYAISGRSPVVALLGKLLPQTVIYTILMWFVDVWFYKYLGFPCNCGLPTMMAVVFLTVIASQGFATFLFGILAGEMRLAMCVCSLWGILSFSMAGLTFPVTAMSPFLRFMSIWFPLRHYYLIYVNSALNGYSLHYVWLSLAMLACFAFMPLLVLSRYHKAFKQFKYIA